MGHFGVPYGVPKFIKNQLLAQKVVPGTMLSSTFVAHCVFPVFPIVFLLDFRPKNDEETPRFFCKLYVFFELGDLHETLYFIGPELCFQFSSF